MFGDLPRWLVLLPLLASSLGCSPREIQLDATVSVPVYLSPALTLDGQSIEGTPVEEDYELEVAFQPPQVGTKQGADPPYRRVTEAGQAYLLPGNCVQRATLYVGRYEGLLVLIPVGNTYAGVEGEIVQLRRAGP